MGPEYNGSLQEQELVGIAGPGGCGQQEAELALRGIVHTITDIIDVANDLLGRVFGRRIDQDVLNYPADSVSVETLFLMI